MQKFVYYFLNKFFMSEVETEILTCVPKKNKIVFDVGCFIGNFTKNILKDDYKNGLKSNFYLFDPNPKVKKYLNLLLKNKKIKYFNLALNNTVAKKTFNLNEYFESSGSGLKSSHKNDKLYNFSRKLIMQIIQPFKKINGYKKIILKTQTLDNFCKLNNIKCIDILKLDTEGNEYEILIGAKNLLAKKKIKVIFTEISGTKKNFNFKEKQIINFLKKYNFVRTKVYDMKILSFLSNLKGNDSLFIQKLSNK